MTSAAYTASMINGKNELREFFQVEDDLTEEEKLQIDKENACFRISNVEFNKHTSIVH